MTARDDALLAPAAVRVVEGRAQQVWRFAVVVQVVNLSLNPLPFTGGTAAQALLVALVVGLFATAWVQHRRHRLRLEAFLDGLDPLGPTADRP